MRQNYVINPQREIFSQYSWHRTLQNDLVGKWQETKS